MWNDIMAPTCCSTRPGDTTGNMDQDLSVVVEKSALSVLSSEVVWEFLMASSDEDLLVLLKAALVARPHLVEEFIGQVGQPVPNEQLSLPTPAPVTPEQSLTVQPSLKTSVPPSRTVNYSEFSKPSLPQIQFAIPIVFVAEEDACATVNVMRIGTSEMIDDGFEQSVAYWETCDGSAKAGRNYVESSGKVVFAIGESYAALKIPLINNNHWDPTLDFYVTLKEEGLQNAELNPLHMQSRIKIMDDDAFPTNRMKEVKTAAVRHDTTDTCLDDDRVNSDESMHETFDKISVVSLIMAYIQMNFRNPIVKTGTHKLLAVDFVSNLVNISTLAITTIMYNALFMPVLDKRATWGNDRLIALACIASWFVIPEHLLHYLRYRKCYWKIAGQSRKLLQANLLRRFLSYTPHARKNADDGEVLLLLFEKIPSLVDKIYIGLFPLVKNLTMIVIIFIYQVSGQFKEPMWLLVHVCILFAFPLVMLCGLKLRIQKSKRLLKSEHRAEVDLSACSVDILNNYQLLVDYSMRGGASLAFEKLVDAFNKAHANHTASTTNNAFIPVSITSVLSTAWIFVGGIILCTDRSMELGTFMANWKIFKWLGAAWSSTYLLMLNMQEASTDLQMLTKFMNEPIENGPLSELLADCERKSREYAERIAKEDAALGCANAVAVDKIPIKVVNLSHMAHMKTIFSNLNMEFVQGAVHAICASRGKGKTTLLRLLSGHVLLNLADETGYLLIPPHLRILQVSKEPLFFLGTLFDNLKYGNKGKVSEDPLLLYKRVCDVCNSLNVDPETIELISDGADAVVAHWNEYLCGSDARLLNMARAFVANPEVIILHKPAMGLGPNSTAHVFHTMRRFVSYRGIVEDESRYFFRRPRTCIFTAVADPTDFADHVHYPFGKPKIDELPVI